MKSITVKDFLESDLAVTSIMAEPLFDEVSKNIKNNESVKISFDGIKVLTTAFLNTAIGQLYDVASKDELNTYVKIDTKNLNKSHFHKIKMVMENSKEKRMENQKLIEEALDHGE